ncbi:ferruginol synthase-like [Cryptomeria japonica]|uniref:ferruginol synthase-like n=1 Tax=Cryptomeria japonica TaxID=3369 RepID=UPI0027D9FF6D|nr:ferruginol synthase-like [Cryptomeria japonica]
MEEQWLIWLSALLSSVLAYFLLDLIGRRMKKRRENLPPGPPAWPIVRNLLQMGRKPNESLWALSQKYGPLMTLSLGMKTAVVVSSSEMAKEMFKTHDQNFAGRTLMESMKVLSHHESSIAFAQYGDYWRKLRRIATTELFTPTRLHALQYLRRDQVSQTIRMVFEQSGKSLNIAHLMFYVGLNLMSNVIFSKKLFDPNNPESAELRNTFNETVRLTGKPNLADLFPFLRFLDPQSVCRDLGDHEKRLHNYLDVFIQDRLEERRRGVDLPKEKDFLDILLDSTAHDFTLENIRALVMELFSAGSDTTSTTVEWAMVELIANPQCLIE